MNLLQTAVEAELRRLSWLEFGERRTSDGRAAVVAQRPPSRTRRADRDRPGHGESTESPGQGRYAGDVPLGTCAALRAQSQIH